MVSKANAFPKPWDGVSFEGVKDQVVPDQSLTLKEILTRFVRGEALPVGQKHTYGSDGSIDPESESNFNVDLEKAKHWDLTEKAEFRDAVMAERERLGKVEASKKKDADEKKALADKAAFDKKVRIAAKKYAKQYPGGTGSSI